MQSLHAGSEDLTRAQLSLGIDANLVVPVRFYLFFFRKEQRIHQAYGETPVFFAARNGRNNILTLLVSAGASLRVTNKVLERLFGPQIWG